MPPEIPWSFLANSHSWFHPPGKWLLPLRRPWQVDRDNGSSLFRVGSAGYSASLFSLRSRSFHRRGRSGGVVNSKSATTPSKHAESENQDSLAILVSRYLCGLSECNERARGKACASRRSTEWFHHEGHEGVKSTAHRAYSNNPGPSFWCTLIAQPIT